MAQLAHSWLSMGRSSGGGFGFMAQSCGHPEHCQCARINLCEHFSYYSLIILLLSFLKSLKLLKALKSCFKRSEAPNYSALVFIKSLGDTLHLPRVCFYVHVCEYLEIEYL